MENTHKGGGRFSEMILTSTPTPSPPSTFWSYFFPIHIHSMITKTQRNRNTTLLQ